MNRSELKKFVTKVLLEKLEQPAVVHGKLIKKTVSFRGIDTECVCEGTVDDINIFAYNEGLEYTNSEDSHFGGHYTSEMTSYEFHPNPEYYGELMETSMSAREQLARICGTNDKVLTEIDVSNVDSLIEFIRTDESFFENKTNMVFEQITNSIANKLYDTKKYTKLFEYLIKQACEVYSDDKTELSESEFEYATQKLIREFFTDTHSDDETTETTTVCRKKSFKTGTAFENMQRIKSGHQMFL